MVAGRAGAAVAAGPLSRRGGCCGCRWSAPVWSGWGGEGAEAIERGDQVGRPGPGVGEAEPALPTASQSRRGVRRRPRTRRWTPPDLGSGMADKSAPLGSDRLVPARRSTRPRMGSLSVGPNSPPCVPEHQVPGRQRGGVTERVGGSAAHPGSPHPQASHVRRCRVSSCRRASRSAVTRLPGSFGRCHTFLKTAGPARPGS